MLTVEEKKQLRNEWRELAAFCWGYPSKPTPPCLACVYAFEMSDDTVKIGMAKNTEKRAKGVANSVYLDVLRVHHTALAPRSFIAKLEHTCHAAFDERRVRGEFFNITFEEAVAELDKHAEEISAALAAADGRFIDELDFYYNEFLPEYEANPPTNIFMPSPQNVMKIEDVHGYIDAQGVVCLNVEDVARGLGFNDSEEPALKKINALLKECGFVYVVGKDDFIPENMFYRLAMKASNATAKKFQSKVADEILPTIRRTGAYSVNSQYEDDPTIEHADPNRSEGQLKNACAYGFLMSNNQVKIGNTSEIPDRIKRMERATKLKVRQEHHTTYTTREKARIIERTLHRIFAAQRLEGEFFNVPFEEVKAELDNQSCLLAEEIHERITEPIDDVKERAKLLVEMLHAPIDSPFKEQLAKETANLLLGEKIF